MKTPFIFLLIFLMVLSGCKIKKPLANNPAVTVKTEESVQMTDFHEQTTWLLGYFSPDLLKRAPHCEWFIKGYDEYQFNIEAINRLMEIKTDSLTIKVVMGTWCPDSRKQVPRFMRIIDLWKFPVSKITFIGVDDAKLSPVGEYNSLDIQRVPTFIFYKNKIESGRIIENPVASLEQDMVNILTRE